MRRFVDAPYMADANFQLKRGVMFLMLPLKVIIMAGVD